MTNYSVLMSVYYKEKPEFFELALKSVLKQSIPSNDIVIVCDGPLTEQLDDVLNKNKNQFFHIIRLEKNSGLGYALNIGLKECINEIVMRADSDDISSPYRAEKQLRIINDGYDVTSSYVGEFCDDPLNIISIKKIPITQCKIQRFVKYRNPFNHPSTMFKKKVVIDCGGYISFPYFEDYYLWLRIIATNKYKFLNSSEMLVSMRIGNSNDLIKRRFTKQAVRSSYRINKEKCSLKIINFFELCYLDLLRFVINIMPMFLKVFVYNNLLRKKNR